MVLAVISSTGEVFYHFFQPQEKVNKDLYLRDIKDKVKPWMDDVAAGASCVFQRNGTPAHTSNIVQNWMAKNFVPPTKFWSKNLWPPSSPDLNPCDYYLWGVLARRINSDRHSNVDSVKKSIAEHCISLPADVVKRAYESCRSGWSKTLPTRAHALSSTCRESCPFRL